MAMFDFLLKKFSKFTRKFEFNLFTVNQKSFEIGKKYMFLDSLKYTRIFQNSVWFPGLPDKVVFYSIRVLQN